jgi:hypothetical protein
VTVTTKITIPMANLTKMIGFAGHAASDDRFGPTVLTAVQFFAGPGDQHVPHFTHRTFDEDKRTVPMLTAAATDRYRLAWASAECTVEGVPESFMVSAAALRSMVRGFPAMGSGRNKRSYDVVIEVLEKSAVRFTVADEAADYEQSTTLARVGGTFPNLSRVLRFGHDQMKPEHFAVSPSFAEQMFAAYSRVHRRREPVAVSITGDNLPVRFSMPTDGEVRASGMLMPVKGD